MFSDSGITCDKRPDCQNHFDASWNLNAMFDESAERSIQQINECKTT